MKTTEGSETEGRTTEGAVPARVPEQFIGEAITPEPGSFSAEQMAGGTPGVPKRFRWRDTVYVVSEVVRSFRDFGPCTHGSGERYVRTHWYEIQTADGTRMTLSVARKPPARRARGSRQGASNAWRLYSMRGR